MTDNKNRTVADVRHIFSKSGGNLGENGCVSWMFEKKGCITVSKEKVSEETLMGIALEAGAEDIREDVEVFEIITSTDEFESVKSALDNASIPCEESEITMLPKTTTNLEGKDAEKMIKLMETLEDSDDVQKVYTNADIPEDMV